MFIVLIYWETAVITSATRFWFPLESDWTRRFIVSWVESRKNCESRWLDDQSRHCRVKRERRRCSLPWHNQEDHEWEHADWSPMPDEGRSNGKTQQGWIGDHQSLVNGQFVPCPGCNTMSVTGERERERNLCYPEWNNFWFHLHRTSQDKTGGRLYSSCYSADGSNKIRCKAIEGFERNSCRSTVKWSEVIPKEKGTIKARRARSRQTEDIWKICWIKWSPLGETTLRWWGILLSLINVLNDVALKRTIAKTKSEKRHLTCWIDQLIFDIRNTKTLDDTASEEEIRSNLLSLNICHPMTIICEDGSPKRTRRKELFPCRDWFRRFVKWTINWYVRFSKNDPLKMINADLDDPFPWQPERIRFRSISFVYLFDCSNTKDCEGPKDSNHPRESRHLVYGGNSTRHRFENNSHKSHSGIHQWWRSTRWRIYRGIELLFIEIDGKETRIEKILSFAPCDHRCSQWNKISRDTCGIDLNISRFRWFRHIWRSIHHRCQCQLINTERQDSWWNE